MKACYFVSPAPLILILLIFSSFAQAMDAWRGPLSSALGGTGRAGLDGPEGVFLNPAQTALLKGYEIDSLFRDGYIDDGQHRQAWGFGAGDNSPDVSFPGALHYLRLRDTGRDPEPVNGELWHAAIGELALENRLAMGVSGYRIAYRRKGQPESVQWNYSVGSLFLITPEVGVAYTLNNLAHPSSKVPKGLREEVQQGAGFFAVVAEIASVRFDVVRNEVNNPHKKLAYMAGFESMSSKFAIFRVGFQRDELRDERYVTAGFGFNGPRLKVDYAFEKNLERASGALHSVDLRLPF